MPLRDWIAVFKIPNTGDKGDKGDSSSQASPLSPLSPRLENLKSSSSDNTVAPVARVAPVGDSENNAAALSLREWIAGFATPATTATTAIEDAVATVARVADSAAQASRFDLDAWGDLRPCLVCRNLSRTGRCLAAWHGEIAAARDFFPPIPDCRGAATATHRPTTTRTKCQDGSAGRGSRRIRRTRLALS